MKLMERFFHLEQPRQLAHWMDLSRLKIVRAKLEQMKLWLADQLLEPRPLNLKLAPRVHQQRRQ